MGSMDLKIGEKLKSIRMARTLSLDDTAVLTGVSKPMLGQIERGQSVPTVTTLWKIDRHGAEDTAVRVPRRTADGIYRYRPGRGKRDLGGRRQDEGIPTVHL